MGIFYLKELDTRPVLEVALKNPDGSAHDLTGASGWELHIRLSTGVRLSRDMVVYGAATDGVLRYTWLASDWAALADLNLNADGAYTLGGLRIGGHEMEYEVVNATSRLTFPNDGNNNDVLRITDDIGQG